MVEGEGDTDILGLIQEVYQVQDGGLVPPYFVVDSCSVQRKDYRRPSRH